MWVPLTGRPGRCLGLAMTLTLLLGCDVLPRDSAGTLERVRHGTLRVGVADHAPWVIFKDGRVSGIEPALLEAWAQRLDARIQWRRGAEAELVEALHRRELDVLAAGLDVRTPYSSKLALTQPYVDIIDSQGRKRHKVLAVVQGENALLLALDRFLAEQDREALRQRAQQALSRPSQSQALPESPGFDGSPLRVHHHAARRSL